MTDPIARPGTQPLSPLPARQAPTPPGAEAPAPTAEAPRPADGAPRDRSLVQTGRLVGGRAVAGARSAQEAAEAGGQIIEGVNLLAGGDLLGAAAQAGAGVAGAVEGTHRAANHLSKASATAGHTNLAAVSRHLRDAVGEHSVIGRAGQGAGGTAAAARGAQGALNAGGGITAGLDQALAGDAVGGGAQAARSFSETVHAAHEAAGGARRVGQALGGEQGRMTQAAERVERHLGEASRLGRLAQGAGGGAAVVGGALHVSEGVGQMRQGEVLQGLATAAGGAGEVAAGTAQVARAAASLTPAAGTVAQLAGRAGPVLGAIAGSVQVVSALRQAEPDYRAAATGAMSTVGSALLPFPPAGTAVGGALVAGAAVLDNWNTIASATQAGLGAVARGWRSLVG
jgi:putative membrane protein